MSELGEIGKEAFENYEVKIRAHVFILCRQDVGRSLPNIVFAEITRIHIK
jgi:hypothetical protein